MAIKTLEVPVRGMDCAECTMHVQKAISALAGVEAVEVYLSSEKAVVQLDPAKVDLAGIRQAVQQPVILCLSRLPGPKARQRRRILPVRS